MTRSSSAAAWPSRPKLAIGLLVALLAGLQLAGTFFLLSVHLPARDATPLTPLRYWQHHGHDPRVRERLLYSLAFGWAVTFGGGIAIAAPRRRPLHGEARFATRREIQAAGLLGDDGILLGRLGRRYLVLPGQQGVELEAPPRSGKGVGVVVPNLLHWPGSILVSDIKGENWTLTAGFRAERGQRVHLFDPLSADERSARWNPLTYVSTVPYRCIDDLQRIASMLYPDHQGADPFWTSSARSLFLGIALYLFETEGSTRTIGEILRQGMASDAEGFQKHWKRVIDTCEREGYPLSQEAVQTLYDVIDLAPVTASSIRKTFTSRLDLWLNPLIDAATAESDFDFRDLRRTPTSIYVRINPDNIARLQPLLNLFFQQAIGLQTRELPEHNPALRHQLLLCLDEFAALGRVPVIADATAFLPGYNVRALLIVQSHSQLVERYGAEGARSLRKMLAARIVFPPKEYDDAEAISKELGTTTVRQKSYSRSAFNAKPPTVSISEQPRRLLLPQEVKELGSDRLLLFHEGLRAVLAHRICYFRDRVFTRRLRKPPEVPRLDLSTVNKAPQAAIKVAPPQPPQVRPLEPGDLHRLDELTLDDFSLDFSDIEIPKGRPLTDDEIRDVVDRFLAAPNP